MLDKVLSFFKTNTNTGFKTPDGSDVILLEQGQKLEDITFSSKPIVTKEFEDIRGFLSYVNDFKESNTVIFAGKKKIQATFDYHQKEGRNSCKHNIFYTLKINPIFEEWLEKNNEWQSQRDFADFVEANLLSFVNPTHGELLSIVKDFRANINADIESKVKGGKQEINFKKVTTGGGVTTVEIPEAAELCIVPLIGFPREGNLVINCKARLNFRIRQESSEPKVEFMFSIFNLNQIYDEFIESVKQYVSKNCEGVKVYLS